MGRIAIPQAGALAFYGKNTQAITHIGFMIDENRMVEAGGGDSTTTDVNKAVQRGAFVRQAPYNRRKDLVAVLMPDYPNWVINS